MAKEDKNRQLTEEQEKLFFEYFKHLTTINLATALVMLAIYRETDIDVGSVGIVLAALGISFIIAGCTLVVIPVHAGPTSGPEPAHRTAISGNYPLRIR